MNKITELEKLLNEEFIIELDDSINEILNIIDSEKNTKDAQKELDELEEIKVYFDDVLLDIKNDKLSENDAIDILNILEEMSFENK